MTATPPTDTAAALWTAIRYAAGDFIREGDEQAIDRAITAHVEAEVARRLAGMRPALSRDGAEALIDEFARRFAARSRSANRGTAVWEREATARTALLRALGVEA